MPRLYGLCPRRKAEERLKVPEAGASFLRIKPAVRLVFGSMTRDNLKKSRHSPSYERMRTADENTLFSVRIQHLSRRLPCFTVRPAWLLCGWLCLSALVLQGSEAPSALEPDNGVVCRINYLSSEVVSKRDVDDRIGQKADVLNGQKKDLMQRGQWTPERERAWDAEYIPLFQDALRKIVRERLLVQCAKEAKLTVDEKQFRKRYETQLARIRDVQIRMREANMAASVDITPTEVAERLREAMLIEMYSSRFMDSLMLPRRPEVERCYKENISRYQRPAGVKVRVIRIDRFQTKALTNQRVLVPNSYETACGIRKDLVQYGASFEEMARKHSDDAQTRDAGGLISVNPKDPYIDPETYNAQLAKAIRGLNPKEISEVFDNGKDAYAIALVEDRREAGPAPLNDTLFEEIYNSLVELKSRKEEDAWFRATLKKSLVSFCTSDSAQKELGIDFFFPDEKPVR